jgi:hypothetical protein
MMPRPNDSIRFILLTLLVLSAALGGGSAQEDEEIRFGEIAVSSDPPGASIYLDDVLLDKKTNGFILDVYPGIHAIRLTLPGYRDYERIISVDSGEITFVYHEFEQIVGNLVVSSEPEGAEIYLNGNYYGKTNTYLSDLPEGEYTIRLSIEGYPDRTGSIRVEEDTTVSYFYDFRLTPTTGSIEVTSEPRGAAIYLDGRYQGVTNRILREVQPGIHGIVLEKTGYKNTSAEIEVTAGETAELFLRLSEEDGRLSIETAPAQADVYIDGGFAGQTPFSGTYPAGRHRVDLRSHGFAEYSEVVTLTYEGHAIDAELVPLAPEAIAIAEKKIAENSQYDQTRATSELDYARELLARKDYAEAYDAALRAGALAEDIDGDGVPNFLDLQPTVRNAWLYIVSLLALGGSLLVIGYDWVRLNPHPRLLLRMESGSAATSVDLALSVGMDRPYRALICTVSHNEEVVDYISEPGDHRIALGEIGPGRHTVTAECTVEKIRYGLSRATAALEFELAAEHPGTQDAEGDPDPGREEGGSDPR